MKTTVILPIMRNILLAILVLRLEQAKCAVSTCGGTLQRRTDTFTSPNYPFPPKLEPSARGVGSLPGEDDRIICEWEITVPHGLEILLNFGDFDMAAGLDECQKGELEVFSGIKNRKKTLDKYCGSDDLHKVLIESNSATVIFRRPKTFSGKGFLVSYIATEPGGSADAFVTCADRGSDHVGVGTFSVLCPGGCANLTESNVWGEKSYRDNSYLCKAAVHAGLISDYFGGRVSVKRVPGDIMYMGFEANGIITLSGAMSDFKIQFLNKTTCQRKLMFDHGALSASSYWIPDGIQDKGTWGPKYGILNDQINAWGPSDPTTTQWLQVDLKKIFTITGIETKGSTDEYYTTKSYRIAYSNDSIKWIFYQEQGLRKDKVFSGNQNIFQASRNNFVNPRIVARFVRVYPTPVKSEQERYSLQMQLQGCPTNVPTPSIHRPPTTTATTTTTVTTRTTVSETTKKIIVRPPLITIGMNTTPTSDHTTIPPFLSPGDQETIPELVAPATEKPSNKMNENSIIVIAIVAALAVTSILLAALVLFLVRKRKKAPKDLPTHDRQLNNIQNNNNNKLFKNKKNKKRGAKHGEEFQNISYRDTIDPFLTVGGAVNIVPSSTLPADQVRFVNGNGGTSYIAGKAVSPEEDDEDHEYQVIPEDFSLVNEGSVPLPSRPISSKHSTGSSMGSSRKSDTMQRPSMIDSWTKSPFGTNSPTFSMNQRSIHTPNPTFSSFAHNVQETFPYPGNGPQVTRSGTFPKEILYSMGSGMMKEGIPSSQIHPGIRRGSSQSPAGPNRHSSSSNNSSHSHPIAMTSYPHGNVQQHGYYPPGGENQPVTAMNHTGYLMYGDQTIPGNETNGIKRKQPSYKTPRQFSFEAPQLPDKNPLAYDPRKDMGYASRGGSDPDITEEQNDVMGHMKSHSVNIPRSQDYDRLYRNNSLNDGNNTTNYSTLDGSHNQYNQLNLNAAPV